MKELALDEIIKEAKKIGSYLITITTKDKSREENDLNHYVFREDFYQDDVIGSLDGCVRSIGIKSPKSPTITFSPPIREKKRPLKIAIVTHFSRCPESYSPGKAVKNLIKMLLKHNHIPVFFTQEGSKLTKDDIGCEVRHAVTKFKREKNVIDEEAKKKFIDVLREQLTSDFDLIITFDMFIDDCITYREAIKECGVNIPWLHFARSGIGNPIDFNMSNARYVYLNYADTQIFADRIGVSIDKVRTIFNEKDGEFFFKWDPITTMIVNKFRLWEKDIIQTYPICSTRITAKGLLDIIRVFGKLKELGNKVCLIVPNSNGRKRTEELKNVQKMTLDYGLNSQDFIFTSLLADEKYDIASEVPNKVVSELFQLSNLFIFATRAENGPNILLESGMTKNLIVVNEDLPLLYDFVNKDAVLSYPFTSNRNLHYTGRDDDSLMKLAKQINGQIRANKADLMFRYIWRRHNADTIYYDMLEPVLYEGIKE